MVNGSIVNIKTMGDEKLFIIKAFIKNRNGKRLAILEEICSISTHIKLEDISLLKLIWSPKRLINERKEYEVLEQAQTFKK